MSLQHKQEKADPQRNILPGSSQHVAKSGSGLGFLALPCSPSACEEEKKNLLWTEQEELKDSSSVFLLGISIGSDRQGGSSLVLKSLT